jgi:hypothetical protein
MVAVPKFCLALGLMAQTTQHLPHGTFQALLIRKELQKQL